MINFRRGLYAPATKRQARAIDQRITPAVLLSDSETGFAFLMAALTFARAYRAGRATQNLFADAWTLWTDYEREDGAA